MDLQTVKRTRTLWRRKANYDVTHGTALKHHNDAASAVAHAQSGFLLMLVSPVEAYADVSALPLA